MNQLMYALIVGAGATLLIDLWSMARKHLFGIPPPDYSLVGRWLGHMPSGRFRHDRITDAPFVRGERMLGWAAHYLIGVAFAGLLLEIVEPEWIHQPTIVPALLVGVLTIAAPFLLMQPGMGAGIAASRAPRPGAARVQSLITHSIFGLGLYAAAWLVSCLLSPS